MSLSKLLVVFLSFVASATVLASPHLARSAHHRAIAGRVAVPVAANIPIPQIRRRQNTKRCKPRPSSAQLVNESTTSQAPEAEQTPNLPKPVTTQVRVTTKNPATSNYQPPPAPTPKPAKAPTSNLPSFMVGTQSGQGTFYATGLGACGITNKDTDYIAAVSHLLFDAFPGYNDVNPNNNPICGRKVTATYQGKSVTVTITDRCTGCQIGDLDFSPSAFSQLADFAVGRLQGLTWVWD